MKRHIAPNMLVIVFAATFLTMAAKARASDDACSLAHAAGTYGFTDSGTIVGVGPRAAAGILTLDAAGNINNGKVTASLNGNVAHSTLSGTYTVNSDCTGTASFDEFDQSGNLILTATADLIWDDSMKQLRFVFTSVVLAGGTSLPIAVNGGARKLVS